MRDDVQKDNRKALPKYLLALLGTGFFGGVIGFLVGFAGNSGFGESAAELLNMLLEAITPWGIPVTSVVLLGAAWWRYRKAKRQCAVWNGEDEDVIDGAECQLNMIVLLTTLQMMLDFLFFAAAVVYWIPGRLTILVEVGCFLVSIAAIIVIQQRVVDMTRRLNPEKQGSIYDLKFKKKWMASCDEAEQKQVGQAAFKAYNALNAACPIVWAVLLMLGFVFDTGLLPAFVVVLIWGILNISYIVECIRLSRRPIP